MFTKLLHKIMFVIKDQPYFEWLKPMGGNLNTRDSKVRCSYHKDHGHITENCKILKQFLERLVNQGRFTEYLKGTEKAKKKEIGDEKYIGPIKRQVNWLVTSIINAIHTSKAEKPFQRMQFGST